ncbi:MAG: hypothetical protein AAGK14_04335 [Verrucomicrobiota bacterium]
MGALWVYTAIFVIHPDALEAYHQNAYISPESGLLGWWERFEQEGAYWGFLVGRTLVVTFPFVPVFILGWVLLLLGSAGKKTTQAN